MSISFCYCIVSLLLFQEKNLTLNLELPGIVPRWFGDTKQEQGEGNNRVIFDNGRIIESESGLSLHFLSSYFFLIFVQD